MITWPLSLAVPDGSYRLHEWSDPSDTAHALACVAMTTWRQCHEC